MAEQSLSPSHELRLPRQLRRQLQALDKSQIQAVLASLSEEQAEALRWDWELWARDAQLPPPGDWSTWFICAGRGFGKTRSGAEWIRDQVKAGARRMALVAATAADARDTMVEGESGLLAISPPHERPLYEASKRRVTWPNGAIATLYSSERPDRLRGPQQEVAWCDELAAWKYPQETWDNLLFGLRLGASRVVVTTTPRPTKLVRALLADPTTAVSRGTTDENRANLSKTFYSTVVGKYAGTRLGRQELRAELLEDTPGALWTLALLEQNRVSAAPELVRIVVAIDPAVSANEHSAETGIVVAGLSEEGHGYLLEDRSGKYSPNEWAAIALELFDSYQADKIIAEVNQGGDLVESNLRTHRRNAPVKKIHASRGKRVRAEPISSLDEQHKIHHVGVFPALEDQLTTWDASSSAASPDRLDARVWAFTELMLGCEPAQPSDFPVIDRRE